MARKQGNGNNGGVPFPPETVEEYKGRVEALLEGIRSKGGKPISKRRLRDVMRWYADIGECEIWQDRPWTAAKVDVVIGTIHFIKIGFAKVRTPDEWSLQRGEDVAVGKAVCKAVKDQINSMSSEECAIFVEDLSEALGDELIALGKSSLCFQSRHSNPYRAWLD